MNRLRLCTARFLNLKSVKYEGQRHIKRWVAPTQMEITRRKKDAGPQPLPKRNTFLEWNRDAELYAFSKRLLEEFDVSKLDQAFTHKSYVFSENQRMKELGIEGAVSILDNETQIEKGRETVSKAVYAFLETNLRQMPHDVIKAIHDYLLSEETLANASLHIGTTDIILTEEHPVSKETLANTFLAIVNALEESTDTNRAANFVKDFLTTDLAQKDLTELWEPSNPVEYLNDLLAKRKQAEAEPRLISSTGKNTLIPAYQVGIYSDKQFLGSGFGETVEEAVNVAAVNVIYRLFGFADGAPVFKFNTPINIA